MEQKFSEDMVAEKLGTAGEGMAAEDTAVEDTAAEDTEKSPMLQTDPVVLEVKLSAKDLWKFSMYHSNKGGLGMFNLIFSVVAIFLLITTWGDNTAVYRVLLVICALMFTVWQPFLLYLKAAKQAKTPAIVNAMRLSFSKEGVVVSQGEERLELEWENIARVENVRDMIIVYMDRVHAYLLPDSITGEKKAVLCGLMKENMAPERRKRI